MNPGVVRHPRFGLAAPALGWVPAPRYLLRRARVLDLLDGIEPGRVLEVGPGAGALLADLVERGFEATGLETSEPARALAGQLLGHLPAVRLHATAEPGWERQFDLVVACEVLEHIEDDLGALRRWAGWMRPGGWMLLSVPAHRRMWSYEDDELAGHYRRYDRGDLEGRAREAGLAVEHLECYGFPMGNLVRRLRILAVRRRRRAGEGERVPSRQQRTARSGIERGLEVRLFSLAASRLGILALQGGGWLQERFLGRDLGLGYLALLRRPTP